MAMFRVANPLKQGKKESTSADVEVDSFFVGDYQYGAVEGLPWVIVIT